MTARKWVLLVAFVLAEAALLKLGWWQYHRMQEKETARTAFMADLPNQTVTLTGTFDHNREVVLESQMNGEEPGYRILTPLLTPDKQDILVDRGWIERELTPGFLDKYKTQGIQTVQGIWRQPPTLHGWLRGPLEGRGAVRVLMYVKPDAIAVADGYTRPYRYLQATTQTAKGVAAFINPPPGGDQHRQYMWTWWGLAAVLLVLAGRAWWAGRS